PVISSAGSAGTVGGSAGPPKRGNPSTFRCPGGSCVTSPRLPHTPRTAAETLTAPCVSLQPAMAPSRSALGGWGCESGRRGSLSSRDCKEPDCVANLSWSAICCPGAAHAVAESTRTWCGRRCAGLARTTGERGREEASAAPAAGRRLLDDEHLREELREHRQRCRAGSDPESGAGDA